MSRDNLDPYSHPCVFHLTYAGYGAFWTYKKKKKKKKTIIGAQDTCVYVTGVI